MRDFLPIKMHKSPRKAGFHADLLPDRLILSEGPARIAGALRTPRGWKDLRTFPAAAYHLAWQTR